MEPHLVLPVHGPVVTFFPWGNMDKYLLYTRWSANNRPPLRNGSTQVALSDPVSLLGLLTGTWVTPIQLPLKSSPQLRKAASSLPPRYLQAFQP